LQRVIRNPIAQRRLDRFLVSAVIEARSSERLSLLASALPDSNLRSLYAELALSELGHQSLFFGIAIRCQEDEDAARRLNAILDDEAEILREVGIRPAIH
jgi:tRNA-(ms[2]io[6]A)-hydroxylase